MTKEQTDLLPCPFCSGSDQMVIDRTCDRNTPYNPADFAYPRVVCRCGAEVAGQNWTGKETAVEAWNRRASPSPAGGVQGVTVAPLVWEGYRAEMQFGHYLIEKYGRTWGVYLNRDLTAECDDELAAFKAAEADHEQRILSSLSSQAQTTGGVE